MVVGWCRAGPKRLLPSRAVGEIVEFRSNGDVAAGHLATPSSNPNGAGVLVIQEWWGLVPQITRVVDRLATHGYVAMAPDLYHGELAEHTEMGRAGALMAALPPDRAARDMNGAVHALLAHDAVRGASVGVLGFCMGGALALLLAANQGRRVGAAVSFYGAPLGDMAPDWSGLTAPVLGHFAENDDWFPQPAIEELEAMLKAAGKDVTFHFYPGTGHAFGNEENPLGTHDPEAAEQAWDRTLEFLGSRLVAPS